MKMYKNKKTGAFYTKWDIDMASEIAGYNVLRRNKNIMGVIDLLKKGHKIAAIKEYKNIFKCSLIEAKTAVDVIALDVERFRKT